MDPAMMFKPIEESLMPVKENQKAMHLTKGIAETYTVATRHD